MIKVKKSPTADTRTCDVTKVTKEQLRESSISHIRDVVAGLQVFSKMLHNKAATHDHDKIADLDWFYSDFRTGFQETGWWDRHRKITRHHLSHDDGIPRDVNLLDVLEYIDDCVMAGMARSGKVYPLECSAGLLVRAFRNTVALLEKQVQVVDVTADVANNDNAAMAVISSNAVGGLEAQGHLPTINAMLANGCGWAEIAAAINWDEDTLREHYHNASTARPVLQLEDEESARTESVQVRAGEKGSPAAFYLGDEMLAAVELYEGRLRVLAFPRGQETPVVTELE